jgi:hypothetical protein
MILSTHGVIASQIQSFVGLLDLYPSAAAAYSVRKLRTLYTGSAIRVRRSSDNAEQDIGFVAENLDTTALTTFCSGTNGFVTTWYDQSGNANNAINTTAANQPQIVSSGSIITQNSKPIIKFDITDELILTNINVNVADSSFFMTYKKSVTGDNVVFINTGSSYLHLDYGVNQYYGNIQNTIGTFNTTNYMLKSASMTYNSSLKWYKDNALLLDVTSGFTSGQQVSKLFGTAFARLESFSSEIIIYASSQSANVSGINTNINSYYAIY